MKPEIKKLWVEALRSGHYSQGRFSLCECDRYCCLGVLCELAAKEGIVTREHDESEIKYDDEKALLPEAVVEWADLDAYNPSVEYAGKNRFLSELNDEQQLTFDEIADIIEDRL